MYGEHYDHRRLLGPYSRVKRQPPLPEDMPDEATAEAIREKARQYPKATPEEVRFFMEHEDGRTGITMRQARAVLCKGE